MFRPVPPVIQKIREYLAMKRKPAQFFGVWGNVETDIKMTRAPVDSEYTDEVDWARSTILLDHHSGLNSIQAERSRLHGRLEE